MALVSFQGHAFSKSIFLSRKRF